MIFELSGRFIDDTASARAERSSRGILVTTESSVRGVSSLSSAIRLACEHVGPLMECGDRAGEGWGLLVTAGGLSIAYGNWPTGRSRKPGAELELLRRILNEYRPGDGARAALHNAAKVIDAYAYHRSHQLQSAA